MEERTNKPGPKKGSPKTGGRKAGTPNKVTSKTRKELSDLLLGKMDKFEKILDDLSVDDPPLFAALYIKTLPYVIPRLNAVDINDNTKRDITLETKLRMMAEGNCD